MISLDFFKMDYHPPPPLLLGREAKGVVGQPGAARREPSGATEGGTRRPPQILPPPTPSKVETQGMDGGRDSEQLRGYLSILASVRSRARSRGAWRARVNTCEGGR